MAKVIVLGGCGAVGSVVVKTLAGLADFSEIVIADINATRADELTAEIKSDSQLSARQVDATDPDGIRTAIEDCDLVVNCIGPFYKTVRSIVDAVLAAGINYLDVCDDVDVTLELLAMNDRVKQAGRTMIIGMGNSPGVTNLLARLAAEHLLDETEAVDIFHAHGGEPFEGKGVIGHRFHCMSIDIPMYLNGALAYVKFFEEDGRALRTAFDFPLLGKEIEVYPYPHPEQVTLPRYLTLNQVTNRGTILPTPYYRLTKDLCRLGLSEKEPLTVEGHTITPYDFAAAYLIRERERILKETDFGTQKGCTSTVVTGTKDGKRQEIRFHMASDNQGLGEGTGIPAAVGAALLQRGRISETGICPPEAAIDPKEFIELIPGVLEGNRARDPGKSEVLMVEIIDENGEKTTMDMMDAAKMF